MKAKRQNAAIMALLVFFFSVFPAKRSEAFAPPLIYAAYMTATTGAGTYTIAALAGAIGIAGMYLTVQDAMDNTVRIPVGPNASNQPPAPAAAASQSPSSNTTYHCSYGGYTNSANSVNDACAASFAAKQAQTVATYGTCPNANITTCESFGGVTGVPGNYKILVTWTSYCMSASCIGGKTYGDVFSSGTSQGTVNVSTTSQSTCPGGYTLSGGSCALSNARQATDDKSCDLLYSQGAFATASDMNCGSSADGTKVAPMIRDGKVIAYGTNSSGQPLMWEVTPGPQTWTVKEYEQVQTATQTQVRQTTATIDAATSAVTSVQTQTSPGSISSPGSASVPTVTDPVTQPTSPTNTPTTTTNPEGIVFPNDYARTGEAKNAADSITELMKPTSEVSDPTVPEWADNWGATFNPLKAWSMPGHSSSCPVGGFSWNGAAYTIDAHCQLINDHWSGLQTASIVVWTVTALWILLGA